MVTAALPRVAAYRPRIVWSTGTVLDTSEYDDVSRYYLNSPGLQVDGIGREQLRAYAPPKAPQFDLTLDNNSGRFSPGGPLANFLGRGPAVTLDALYGVDVLGDAADVLGDSPDVLGDGYQTKRLFTGSANAMPQSISRGQRTVSVTAFGAMSAQLVGKKPLTPLYEGIRTDQAVSIILDWVGWSADKRAVSLGSTTLLYWWLNGQTTAISAINALLAAEGAGSCCYEDGDGVLHWEGRSFREANPRSANVQWVFSDGVNSANPTGDDPLTLGDSPTVLGDGPLVNPLFHIIPAQYTSNPDEVVKSVAVTVNTRTPTPTQTIGTERMKVWEYGGPLVLSPSQVLDVQVTSPDPFKSAVTPVLGTDYSIGAGSLVAVSLLSTSGQTITARWTAGPGGCTLNGPTSNGPQVRAISLPVTSQQVVTSTLNTESAAARTQAQDPLVLDAWAEVERNQMLDVVNSMAQRYQRERRQIQFQTTNIDAAHMYAILNIRVSDRIQFVHTHAGLNIVAWVEQLSYLFAPGGGKIVLTVGCEQVFDLVGGKFDTALFDIAVFGLG